MCSFQLLPVRYSGDVSAIPACYLMILGRTSTGILLSRTAFLKRQDALGASWTSFTSGRVTTPPEHVLTCFRVCMMPITCSGAP